MKRCAVSESSGPDRMPGGLELDEVADLVDALRFVVGPVDLDKLAQLEGQFGVPELGIESQKPKTKN